MEDRITRPKSLLEQIGDHITAVRGALSVRRVEYLGRLAMDLREHGWEVDTKPLPTQRVIWVSHPRSARTAKITAQRQLGAWYYRVEAQDADPFVLTTTPCVPPGRAFNHIRDVLSDRETL